MAFATTIRSSLAVSFFLILSVGLFAQGAISGTILDEGSGEPLIGATIQVDGTGIGTVTDFDGKYSFKVEAGTYTLKVTYIGYPDKTLEEIAVTDGEVTYQNVTLSEEGGIDIETVVVKAERLTNTEVAVLVERKEALVVSDNISVQEMARYGASDATGALRKVTGASVEGGKYIFVRGLGDRYSLSQLNGLVIPSTDPYRNSAQLDLIPTSLVDNISTAKTFTPDQPGSFTGGNVDIRTKKFPDLPTFTISLSAGFNSQSNLIDDFLTHSGGTNDYLGYDNARAIPAAITDPNIRPLLNNRSEGLARRNGNEEAANALDAGVRSLIPQVTPTDSRSSLDHGVSLAYGNKFEMGLNTLGVIATLSFKQDYQNLDDFQEGNWSILFLEDEELFNNGDFNVNRSILNPTTSGLVGLAYRLGENNELSFTSMYNHSSEKTSRTVFGERPDNLFFPRLLEGFQ
ncbi:MAG: carboxypeptidase-like regulatory domain-containing protein, partial [Bacteroidota bacterium]